MKTGNRRRRKLNRLAKARALRARCQLWQRQQEHEHWYRTVAIPAMRWEEIRRDEIAELNRTYSDVNDAIMSTIDFSWSE